MMRQLDLVQRVRSLTRDFSGSIFRESDITDYVNEGIDRIIQVLPMCKGMPYLTAKTDEVRVLPIPYHSLLALFSASRCFSQDEKHYQASTLMNEFELKMQELKVAVENGEVTIIGTDNVPLSASNNVDFVQTDDYFEARSGSLYDDDEGVEGVE